eukprot:8188972-Pyramimonas_sp.AAC.1
MFKFSEGVWILGGFLGWLPDAFPELGLLLHHPWRPGGVLSLTRDLLGVQAIGVLVYWWACPAPALTDSATQLRYWAPL